MIFVYPVGLCRHTLGSWLDHTRANAPVLKLNKLIKKHAGWKRDRVETDWKEELDERKPLPTISWTILLLALTSWDKKLEIPISCPDAKAGS